MSDENKELMARISQIAGQINRAKAQQTGVTQNTTNPSLRPAHHRYNAVRGVGRAGNFRVGRPLAAHRNRSLVINNASGQSTSAASAPDAPPSEANAAGPSPTWVSRNDRHRQLINSAVFEKDSHARVKAMEITRQQKLRARDLKEKIKLMNHLSRAGTGAPPGTPTTASSAAPNLSGGLSTHAIDVDGVPFRVVKNGSKLVRAPGYFGSGNPTPKVAVVGGVKFHRSKNGNLYRGGIVNAHRLSGKAIKKSNEPCKNFSTTGSCPKGPHCRYRHDAAKVAICKEFLKGSCPHGDACDLSHDVTPERTPACLHYAKGNCTNPTCIYTHACVTPGAPVCRAFGLYGYCQKGAACTDRHVFECPDFSNTGKCKATGCKLLHRERASLLRKQTSAAAGDGDDEDMSDLSSDDEDFADSDDVDSDEVEEFIDADLDDADFQGQKDYIAF